MRILKIKGKDEKIILNQIEKQYGDKVVVLSTQKEAVGRFKLFKTPKTVITIAVKDEEYDLSVHENLERIKNVPNIQKEDNKESNEAVKMLLDLNEHIKNMEMTLQNLQNQAAPNRKIIESSSNNVLAYLKEKMIGIGIKQPICEWMLDSVAEENNAEEIIKIIHIKIEELLTNHKADEELPQTVFFIGSTGVGKTTTIAKLTAQYVLEKHKKVVLFTSDTYRIAAIEQLKTYADILGVPIEIIYDEQDIPELLKKWQHVDYIFIDTAGRSHKNVEQVNELLSLLKSVTEKRVFLVVNANTATTDVMNVIDTYGEVQNDVELIITKLDETDEIGNILNIQSYAQRPIKYITIGQNVPADIKLFTHEEYIADLLGRVQYE
ncbi:flagellar biosynthesis protein FlhF [Cellulosilyticum ruminicola]|uniref:flagellar biosynthesis protein FlhF n=1 Tax=Cellulosilyticum ruminicola TaxID=425254 RepID=UPI0006D1C8B0|nr:flagellar biosynthesis protein FlhF [Cellulosilyticum ruminicola]